MSMIRRRLPKSHCYFCTIAKYKLYKNWPELFCPRLPTKISLMEAPQEIGDDWEEEIICPNLPQWPQNHAWVGPNFIKFYLYKGIIYFWNYNMISNFTKIDINICVFIWRKKISRNLIFSKIWRVFWRKSGEIWRNF